MLAKVYRLVLHLTLVISTVYAASPSIVFPANDSVIAPNEHFKFHYQSIADSGVSSYNFTCWLFTSPPRQILRAVKHVCYGLSPGPILAVELPCRFKLATANKSPHNPPPATFKMPDFSKMGAGWGVGSHATHAKIFFAVVEEWGDGEPSLGYRMSLSVNEIMYNGTAH
ncbi:hypothetical protein MVEN_00382100 [Mycena venus]|uniref:Uncharacterized protein n=1 Tax=Mycena venus TaxID=2733690 RepID=A0A8H6YRU5_9AGAR|nr:hypothetical protein MVEN_00382100 [Mycena venus]